MNCTFCQQETQQLHPLQWTCLNCPLRVIFIRSNTMEKTYTATAFIVYLRDTPYQLITLRGKTMLITNYGNPEQTCLVKLNYKADITPQNATQFATKLFINRIFS